MIDFTNTEIAFKIKSNAELRKARFLFKTINNPKLVGWLSALATFAVKNHIPIGWLVKPTLYAQFVGGVSLAKSANKARKLWKYKVGSILDYSVEGKSDDASTKACFKEVMRSIEFGGKHPYVAFAVFKPTGIIQPEVLEKVSSGVALDEGEEERFHLFVKRVDALCAKAAEVGISILIDAEDYCYLQVIDEVAEQMMERYNTEKAVVYHTLQMYRTDRLEYLKMLHKRAVEKNFIAGAKLVRGAYMERERERAAQLGYPSPINPTKEITDTMFDDALVYSLENIDKISIFAGTHNQDSTWFLVELIYKYSLQENDRRIWFSQLYGMSDNLTFNLAAEGFNVAKYLPYGSVKEVFPYLIRRARENTSVAEQASRELDLINQEIKRRKSYKQW
ncbi:proline dehydrogenase family protein [uncultured Acetobacteroides sp.]|uniref:proline dehydrogenase family protein n=1 Tax=uncultured Acetobacteroides sp. TaxID=1760811 RepID=UPI0029F5446C|nr:proline dehydrogenase family protein [uncultured Acetobacteroides sp.]